MIEKFVKQHPTVTMANDMAEICRPLEKLGIVYFSQVNIEENKLSCLALNPAFFKLYFEKGYHHYDLHKLESKEEPKKQLILWDTIERRDQTEALHKDFMSFDQGHTFSIIYNHDASNRECYHFGARLDNTSINQEYLNNLDALEKFILYFKDQVRQHKSLSSAYDMKMGLTKHIGGYLTEDRHKRFDLNAFNESIQLNRIYVQDKNTYLTSREVEVLHWLSFNKTGEEIAIILGIKPRTVKEHIKNIKLKLNCHNQFQLGMLYQQIVRQL
ncbi:MAG: hypothetical protein DHS20C09_11170 [marine bacterium B5-7]|nr:MAG: hypothetical protein DHS20C09_11170 [marine bacterium B5-7]